MKLKLSGIHVVTMVKAVATIAQLNKLEIGE